VKSGGTTTISLLGNGQLDTLALWQTDPRLVLSNDENIAQSCGEGVVNGILDVDNIETTIVALTMCHYTHTTHVTSTSNHDQDTGIEGDIFGNFVCGEVNLDGVIDLDERVGVSNGSGIVCDKVRDSLLSKLHSLDLGQFVGSLLWCNSVDSESSFGVVDETEVLTSLLDGDDVHKTGWVGGIGADFSIDLDQPLHEDGLDFTSIESVLETVSQEDDKWETITELVRTW